LELYCLSMHALAFGNFASLTHSTRPTTLDGTMNIFLCYGYVPHTTAVYFEKALRKDHSVHHIGTPFGERLGRSPNEDLADLVEKGILPKPDLVLFMESGSKFFPRGLEQLDCPTAGYLIDVHADFWVRENYAHFFDHIFVAHKDYVNRFEQLGFQNVHWLPVACDADIHGKITSEQPYDIGFVGNLEANAERRRLLLALDERYTMNDFRLAYPKEDISKIYSRSKIVFNYANSKDVNMRVFEALAAGSLLVTNRMENGINDLLRAGEHFVEYTDQQSLFEQVDYFLTHDAERQRIAETGRLAVLSEHTYDLRTSALLNAILSPGAGTRCAKVRTMNPSQLRTAYGKVYSTFRLVDAAFDEFDIAWQAKQGRLAAAHCLGIALLRRLNATVKLSRLGPKESRRAQTLLKRRLLGYVARALPPTRQDRTQKGEAQACHSSRHTSGSRTTTTTTQG